MKNIHVLPTDKPSRLLKQNNNKLILSKQIVYSHISKHLENINQNIYITNDEEIKEWFIVNGTNGYSLPMKYSVMFPKDKFPNGHNKTRLSLLSIILTTDSDLIKDGVQPINDEFLEWFVKNPSCESVEVENDDYVNIDLDEYVDSYKIIIPGEEPKTAWVGVLHDKLNEYHPAEYELKDIYQGEGCLPHFPDEELCQIWCDSKYKEEPNYNMKQEILDEMEKQETLEEFAEREATEFYEKGTVEWNKFRQLIEVGGKWQQERMCGEEEAITNIELAMMQGLTIGQYRDLLIEQFKNK